MRQVSMILGAIVVIGFTWCATSGPRLCVRSVGYGPMPVNSTRQLRAGGVDILEECDLPQDMRVRWSSSDTSLATVNDDGVVRPRRAGSLRMWARSRRIWSGRDSAFYDVNIIPAVARIRLQPRDTVVSSMDTVLYSAQVVWRDSTVRDVSPSIGSIQYGFSGFVRGGEFDRVHLRNKLTEEGLMVWGGGDASGWVVAWIAEYRDSVRLTVR